MSFGARAHAFLTFALLLAMLQSGWSAGWEPCLAMSESYTLTLPFSTMSFTNTTITVFPNNNGVIYQDYNATLQFVGIQEWLTNANDLANNVGCYEANSPYTPGLYSDGTAYNAIIGSTSECLVQQFSSTIPGTSIAIETVMVQVRNATGNPATSVVMNISTTTENHITDYGATANTGGLNYYVRYLTDHFKVTIEVNNWDWQGPAESHLVGYLAGYAYISEVSWVYFGQAQAVANVSIFNATTLYVGADITKYNISFIGEIDHGFLLYNNSGSISDLLGAYMNNLPHSQIGPYLLYPNGIAFGQPFGFGFCHYNPPGHYDQLVWDPQLTMIFSGPPTESPSDAKHAPPYWVAAPVICGIAIIIVVFLVVYMRSSKLQGIFQPYKATQGRDVAGVTKRSPAVEDPNRNTVEAPPASTSWAKKGPSDRNSYL